MGLKRNNFPFETVSWAHKNGSILFIELTSRYFKMIKRVLSRVFTGVAGQEVYSCVIV